MDIMVKYNQTDIAKVLSQLIVHPNAEEIVKLLAYQVGTSSDATNHLFKLHIGHKLFEIIPTGTLCYLHHSCLTYQANVQKMEDAGLINEEGLTIVTVKDFRGYHESSNYSIIFTNIESHSRVETTSWCKHSDLKIIEEF
jgi:hypothetical protein